MTKPNAEPPVLWIDSNEESQHHWSREARTYGFSPIVIPMTVGDFRFMPQGVLWVIERKATPSDLEASFKDGRLTTQHWRGQDEGIERLVLLCEGDINACELAASVKGAVMELQGEGVFIDFAKPGQVMLRLMEMHRFLEKDDHALLRRPPMPMPNLYRYTDRDFRRRVQTLMTFSGVSEKSAVEALRRYTLDVILQDPRVMREAVPGIAVSTLERVYWHLQREVPEGLRPDKPVKKRVNKVDSMNSSEDEMITIARVGG
jgi:ERCC4-type nuclease